MPYLNVRCLRARTTRKQRHAKFSRNRQRNDDGVGKSGVVEHKSGISETR